MGSKGIITIPWMLAGIILLAGCDSGGVLKASVDKSTVKLNSLTADATVMERDISFVTVNFTARKSLSPTDYAVTWRVVDGLENTGLTSWNSTNAFGGLTSEYTGCYGVAYVNTPPPSTVQDPDSDDPADRQLAFLAPPVTQDSDLVVEVSVSADEGVDEEREVTVTSQFTIRVQAYPDRASVSLSDANLNTCYQDAIESCAFFNDPSEYQEAYDDAGLYQLSCATPVTDLTGLDALAGVQQLSLTQLDADDLTPLNSLENLKQLTLEGESAQNGYSGIGGLSNLGELNLTLDITGGSLLLSELQPILAGLNALTLCVEDLGDISLLSEAVNLSALSICDTGTTGLDDASPISTLTQLRSLEYTKDRASATAADLLVDYSLFEPLQQLRELTARSLQLPATRDTGADLNPLSSLPYLQTLDIRTSQVADLTPLAGISSLVNLYAADNYIVELDSLVNNDRLVELNLARNELADDLTVLRELDRIRILNLSGNGLTDIRPLEDLRLMTEVDLSDNALTSLVGITQLTRVINVDISSNNLQATALSSLQNTRIEILNAADNNLDSVDWIERMDELETVDISCNAAIVDIDGIEANLANPDGSVLTNLTLDKALYDAFTTELASLNTQTVTVCP